MLFFTKKKKNHSRLPFFNHDTLPKYKYFHMLLHFQKNESASSKKKYHLFLYIPFKLKLSRNYPQITKSGIFPCVLDNTATSVSFGVQKLNALPKHLGLHK